SQEPARGPNREAAMKPRDVLLAQLDRLELALAEDSAGRERAWAEQADRALAEVERGLRQHTAAAEGPGGLSTAVALTRLSGRVAELRQEHRDFLQRVADLAAEVRAAGQAFEASVSPPPATTLPQPGKVGPVADFGGLRRRADELVAA